MLLSKVCLSDGSDGKETARKIGDLVLTPGLGRSPGDGNGNPLQYSCLENSMDQGAWRAVADGVTESDTTLPLSVTHLGTDFSSK